MTGSALYQRIRYRTGQAARHVTAGGAPVDILPDLDRLLTRNARQRFHLLARVDQRHLIAMAEALTRAGASDDLVTAGLLHDIGKARRDVPIRLHDRVAKVLLAWVAPGLIARPADRPGQPRVGAGLWALARHAEAGADFARAEGYGSRVQWLIAHHESSNPGADADLHLLIAADDGVTHIPAR